MVLLFDAGGTLFLYDRVSVKYFRNDGHDWRKKGDGKAVRETHEKLKLEQVVMLNCYYAHAISPANLQVSRLTQSLLPHPAFSGFVFCSGKPTLALPRQQEV